MCTLFFIPWTNQYLLSNSFRYLFSFMAMFKVRKLIDELYYLADPNPRRQLSVCTADVTV